ncbi:YcxB family protein [Pseudomonas atagonensis]|uniref:YcxB family protein n=1 Tax=Pseudomonas atagonensis TaxID=2609964 RepID=UPI00140B3B05|nr:YcxB family protein [Pseudomonas atagonensis]
MSTMELQYTINPEHTQARIGKLIEQEILKDDQLRARLLGKVARVEDRLLTPLFFLLGLVAGMLAIYFPARELSPEKLVAMVFFALAYAVCWRFYSERLLKRLRKRIDDSRAKPRKPFPKVNQRLIESTIRARLKATEGGYRLVFDDHGFTLIFTKGKSTKVTLAWSQIVRLKVTPDFYSVACAKLDSKGKAYYIPRTSDVMDADSYQQGLELFLSRVPVSVFEGNTLMACNMGTALDSTGEPQQ